MKIISKILFTYSALIIFVLIITTLISSKSINDAIKIIPILPIGIYFLVVILKRFLKPSSTQVEINKPSLVEIILLTLIFAALTYFGINNILTTSKSAAMVENQKTEQEELSETPTSSPVLEIKTITASESAKIFSQPSQTSKIITITKSHEEFKVVSQEKDWYQVTLNDSTRSGWINTQNTIKTP